MAEPEIGVIVSTNSLGEYLGEALDSVQSQTWTYWRLTVIDDGSPHPEVLRELVARYPRMRILRQTAQGAAAGWNHGIRVTNSPFLTFLDDDDVWRPDRLERLVTARLDSKCAVGAYSGGWHMDPSGTRIGHAWSARPSTSGLMLRGITEFPRVICLLVDRAAAHAIGGFDESFSLAADNEFMLRLLAHGELASVPEELVGYRRHPGSLTGTRRIEGRTACIRSLDKNLSVAIAVGDDRLAGQIRENRKRFLRREANTSVRVAWAELRARHGIRFARQFAWAVYAAPGAPFTLLAERARRR